MSILNLLIRLQSCNDNHLLTGANCAEDTPLMKQYTKHLVKEMKLIEGTKFTTDQGHEVEVSFQLIPADINGCHPCQGSSITVLFTFLHLPI